MFKKDFDNYAVLGDFISCELPDGFVARAVIHDDADTMPPDNMPAEALAAWRNDEWFYCGVAVTVYKAGVQLTGEFDHALWGIDCNLYDQLSEQETNWYLRVVANDLLPDALAAAKDKIQELCK